MATKYTTRTATMRQSQVVDQRKIAVGKKVEIGGKYGTVVSDEDIRTKNLYIDYNGQSTNILDIIGTGGGGITPTPIECDRVDVSDGYKTWQNVKKIIFNGATITNGGEEGSIIITIEGGGDTPTIVSPLTSFIINGITTESKYLFGGAGQYVLPTGYTIGTRYNNCYNRATTSPTIKLTGLGENGSFGFNNLSTKIRLTFINSENTTIKTYETAVLNGNVTNGNNWTYTNVTEKDNTVTFENITFNVPTTDLLGSWKVKLSVMLDEEEINVIENDREYFSYISNPYSPTFVGNDFQLTMHGVPSSRSGNKVWLSGIGYPSTTKQYSGFNLKTIPFKNSVYMAESDLNCGLLKVSCGNKEVVKNITLTGDETLNTNISKSYDYDFNTDFGIVDNGQYDFTIQQIIDNDSSGNKTKTMSISTQSDSGGGMVDTYNTAYLEREDGDYGRIAGYIDADEMLKFYDSAYDSEQSVIGDNEIYNHQAVIYNKALVHPSQVISDDSQLNSDAYSKDTSAQPRFYIRKFKRDETSSTISSNFTITIDGFTTMDGTDKELWIFFYNKDYESMLGARIDSDIYGTNTTINGNKIQFQSDPLGEIKENDEVYIVIKLNSKTASVTGNIVIE